MSWLNKWCFSIIHILVLQRIRKDGTLSKASGMQSGGEEEPEDDSHTPLPPPMEIIKDPSTQEEKVHIHTSCGLWSGFPHKSIGMEAEVSSQGVDHG